MEEMGVVNDHAAVGTARQGKAAEWAAGSRVPNLEASDVSNLRHGAVGSQFVQLLAHELRLQEAQWRRAVGSGGGSSSRECSQAAAHGQEMDLPPREERGLPSGIAKEGQSCRGSSQVKVSSSRTRQAPSSPDRRAIGPAGHPRRAERPSALGSTLLQSWREAMSS